MSKLSEGRRFSPHRTSFFLSIFLVPFGLLYRLWGHSIRMRYSSQNGRAELMDSDSPVILVLWHNRLFLAGHWQKKFRQGRQCYGLISASRDGAWLETFYGWVGIHAIRGSRNKRGSQAVRELVKKLKEGNDVGITPDGSRGPKYEAKPGSITVAKLSRSPILLLTFTYSWCIRLKSWDQFVIPLPFSKVEARTKLLPYDELFSGGSLEDITHLVQSTLCQMTHD